MDYCGSWLFVYLPCLNIICIKNENIMDKAHLIGNNLRFLFKL